MRRVDRIVFGLTAAVLTAIAVTAAILVVGHETRCDRFEPRWTTLRTELGPERNQFARLVVQCGRLDNLDRAEVRRRLGRGGAPHARVWTYDAGRNDAQFLSEATLDVFFSAQDRVRKTRLSNHTISSDGDR